MTAAEDLDCKRTPVGWVHDHTADAEDKAGGVDLARFVSNHNNSSPSIGAVVVKAPLEED
jgi:hypothetical protein